LPYYLQSRAAKLQVLGAEYLNESFGAWYYIRSALFITQFLVYLVLIVLSLVKYSRSIREHNLASERAVLFEIRFFVVASTLFYIPHFLDQAGRTISACRSVLSLSGEELQIREACRSMVD